MIHVNIIDGAGILLIFACRIWNYEFLSGWFAKQGNSRGKKKKETISLEPRFSKWFRLLKCSTGYGKKTKTTYLLMAHLLQHVRTEHRIQMVFTCMHGYCVACNCSKKIISLKKRRKQNNIWEEVVQIVWSFRILDMEN